jgi:hypothetical protein
MLQKTLKFSPGILKKLNYRYKVDELFVSNNALHSALNPHPEKVPTGISGKRNYGTYDLSVSSFVDPERFRVQRQRDFVFSCGLPNFH